MKKIIFLISILVMAGYYYKSKEQSFRFNYVTMRSPADLGLEHKLQPENKKFELEEKKAETSDISPYDFETENLFPDLDYPIIEGYREYKEESY